MCVPVTDTRETDRRRRRDVGKQRDRDTQREANRETEREIKWYSKRHKAWRREIERKTGEERGNQRAEQGAQRGVFVTAGDTEGSDRWDVGSGERKRDRNREKGSWRNRE